MKKRVLIFISVVLLVLTIVPIINLKSVTTQKKEGENWWSRSVLYNFDFALPTLSGFFYPLGISNSNQVIIGKDDWLYLGDPYANTVTSTRLGATVENIESAKKIAQATKAWDQWLKFKGVSLYQVMLGSNKGTIYPEFLPDWAQPPPNSALDVLLANVSQDIYIDTRPALKAAKTEFSAPLYYKTDTHWNLLGGWVAFREFAKEIERKEQLGLHWLSDQQLHVSLANDREGGDLANFIRMKKMLHDNEVIIDINDKQLIATNQYDFEIKTGNITAFDSKPNVNTPLPALLVKSQYALNQKKVLWIHDSYGWAMGSFMAATFSETLQLHYNAIDSAQFAQLVNLYKPDYVFITVVERDALSKWFENLPPILPIVDVDWKRQDFISLSKGLLSETNDMTKVEGSEAYRISGVDPSVFFALSTPVLTKNPSQLVFELNCGEKKMPAPIQIFWRTVDTSFNEANSLKLTVNTGISAINLSALSSWNQTGAVTGIRVDFDSLDACPAPSINNLELGRSSLYPNTL